MLDIVPCQSCVGPTIFSTELQLFGDDPGPRIYFCEACRRYTWTSGRAARQPQQQQPKTE